MLAVYEQLDAKGKEIFDEVRTLAASQTSHAMLAISYR
jgi:hypothetical protein